jgi:hypothetical protein
MKYDLQYSLIFAIIFVLGINAASGRNLFESFLNMNLDGPGKFVITTPSPGSFPLLEPQNEIYPGCEGVTLAQLMSIFKDNHYELQTAAQHAFYMLLNDPTYTNSDVKNRLLKTAYMAGLPYNMKLDDHNAPWIASLLVNYGFMVTPTCQPPTTTLE